MSDFKHVRGLTRFAKNATVNWKVIREQELPPLIASIGVAIISALSGGLIAHTGPSCHTFAHMGIGYMAMSVFLCARSRNLNRFPYIGTAIIVGAVCGMTLTITALALGCILHRDRLKELGDLLRINYSLAVREATRHYHTEHTRRLPKVLQGVVADYIQ